MSGNSARGNTLQRSPGTICDVRRWSAFVTGAWLSLGACKPVQETDLPICKSEVVGTEAQEVVAGEIPADIWFLIVLRNYNRATWEVSRPVHDCSGRPVDQAPAETFASCLAGSTAMPLPARPLTPDDLMLVPLDDGNQLVWVKTTYFENGEAMGPIAVAEMSVRGVLIRKLGTMRAQANKAALRMEKMGAAEVVVVEARECDVGEPERCRRVLEILPIVGTTFEERPLVTEDGQCLGEPVFELYREQNVELANGMVRHFKMSRSVEFDEGNAIVTEQINIEDTDPKQPDAPPQVFRSANVQRPLTLSARGLVTKMGLWEKMLEEHGSVRLADDPSKARRD